MPLDSGEWQQVTNIARWMIATGQSEGDLFRAEILNQMGPQVTSEMEFQSDYIWTAILGGVGYYYNAGMANEEMAANLSNEFSPQLYPDLTPAAPGGVPDVTQRSAKASLDGFLSQYGLDSLGDFVWQEYLNNIPIEQIMLDIRDRPEYVARFPYMKALQEKGHAMSEAEAIAYEKQVTGFARAIGFPPDMFDQPADFTPLIVNELSVQEVSQRLQDWVSFADTAPEINKLEMQRLYGVGTGGLAAYFMNPEKALPLLEKQAAATLTSVSSIQSGYGELTQQEAEYIGGFGYEPQQTRQGFGQLVSQKELFNPLNAGEDTIGQQEQLQAMFGSDANAQAEIERRASRRAAEFQQGGQFSQSKEGFSGAGSAR